MIWGAWHVPTDPWSYRLKVDLGVSTPLYFWAIGSGRHFQALEKGKQRDRCVRDIGKSQELPTTGVLKSGGVR